MGEIRTGHWASDLMTSTRSKADHSNPVGGPTRTVTHPTAHDVYGCTLITEATVIQPKLFVLPSWRQTTSRKNSFIPRGHRKLASHAQSLYSNSLLEKQIFHSGNIYYSLVEFNFTLTVKMLTARWRRYETSSTPI